MISARTGELIKHLKGLFCSKVIIIICGKHGGAEEAKQEIIQMNEKYKKNEVLNSIIITRSINQFSVVFFYSFSFFFIECYKHEIVMLFLLMFCLIVWLIKAYFYNFIR